MEKNSDKFSKEQLSRAASSPEARQLYGMLQQTQGADLNAAISKANAGDYTALKKQVDVLLSSPEAQELIRKLGL